MDMLQAHENVRRFATMTTATERDTIAAAPSMHEEWITARLAEAPKLSPSRRNRLALLLCGEPADCDVLVGVEGTPAAAHGLDSDLEEGGQHGAAALQGK